MAKSRRSERTFTSVPFSGTFRSSSPENFIWLIRLPKQRLLCLWNPSVSPCVGLHKCDETQTKKSPKTKRLRHNTDQSILEVWKTWPRPSFYFRKEVWGSGLTSQTHQNRFMVVDLTGRIFLSILSSCWAATQGSWDPLDPRASAVSPGRKSARLRRAAARRRNDFTATRILPSSPVNAPGSGNVFRARRPTPPLSPPPLPDALATPTQSLFAAPSPPSARGASLCAPGTRREGNTPRPSTRPRWPRLAEIGQDRRKGLDTANRVAHWRVRAGRDCGHGQDPLPYPRPTVDRTLEEPAMRRDSDVNPRPERKHLDDGLKVKVRSRRKGWREDRKQ